MQYDLTCRGRRRALAPSSGMSSPYSVLVCETHGTMTEHLPLAEPAPPGPREGPPRRRPSSSAAGSLPLLAYILSLSLSPSSLKLGSSHRAGGAGGAGGIGGRELFGEAAVCTAYPVGSVGGVVRDAQGTRVPGTGYTGGGGHR